MHVPDGFVTLLSASPADRRDLFALTANRLGTIPANVEKDLFVCLALDMLWNGVDRDGKRLLFKGGTSLTKAFGLVNRFSEDIDVTVFGSDLGYEADPEALARLGNNKRREWLKTAKRTCRDFITGPLADRMTEGCREIERLSELPRGSFEISRDADDPDGQSLNFHYPSVVVDPSAYVRPRVLIESGAKSAVDPHVAVNVKPFVADDLPGIDLGVGRITAVDPRRTFGDKVVIIHGINEHIRSKGEALKNGSRLSRHLYDVHMLMEAGIGEQVAQEGTLLASCVDHAMAFFDRPASNLAAARDGTFSILPGAEMEAVLRRDYAAMRDMIFGVPPSFDELMGSLGRLDAMLNDGFSPNP